MRTDALPGTGPHAPLDALQLDERRAIDGDRVAAERVWRAHRGWVAAVLLAHKSRDADLEDLLQDVAVAFLRKVGSVRDARALRGWLRTVAVNAARAARRSQRARLAMVDPGVADGIGRSPGSESARGGSAAQSESGVLPALVRRDDARGVLARLETLPEIYREPLLLRTVRGLSSRQVADLLGVSFATVDTRVARARRMLLQHDASGGALHEESGSHV